MPLVLKTLINMVLTIHQRKALDKEPEGIIFP